MDKEEQLRRMVQAVDGWDDEEDRVQTLLKALQEKYADKIKAMQDEETAVNISLAKSDEILDERIKQTMFTLIMRDRVVKEELRNFIRQEVRAHMEGYAMKMADALR